MKKGKAYLVGAGPGAIDLLTLKGKHTIEIADVIIYDRLANPAMLKWAKKDCEFIYVGKASKDHTMTQEEINELIAQKAMEGNIVTRLKGGDPYVFGRGGEEAQVLIGHDVEYEVVPGITSGIGGLCYAGIPITHRDFASSLHLITGHLKDESHELNWSALANIEGTLVFYMGVKNLEQITSNLIANGKKQTTPVAIINWATHPKQKVVEGTLETICQIAAESNIQPPSLIVVGDVVALRKELNFYEEKALFGKNVVVTRARAQASKLTERLAEEGANVIECPAIEIQPILENLALEKAILEIDKYTHLVFTSQNAVEIFCEKLYEDRDARALAGKKIVTIGPATTAELQKYGLKPDLEAKEYVAEGIVSLLEDELRLTDYILMPRAREARNYLVEKLSEKCKVDEIAIYDTVTAISEEDKQYLTAEEIDYITFTSSSTVKNFFGGLTAVERENIKNAKLISIGPVTSKTIEELGYSVYREANPYTIQGIVDLMIAIEKGEDNHEGK